MDGKYGVGIDIGSTCAKTVIIDSEGMIVWKDLRPTGWSSVDTAEAIRKDLPPEIRNNEKTRFVATGYGRVSVPFADKCVTEISCHAKGAVKLFGLRDLNVIDIGGQDTKLIVIRGGAVTEFIMNDKAQIDDVIVKKLPYNNMSAEEAKELYLKDLENNK